MTIPTQAVREMADEVMGFHHNLENRGAGDGAFGIVMATGVCPEQTRLNLRAVLRETSSTLLALVEERDRLAAELDHQLAERAALTARARELREAQRAYMQNRGNDEYGRKVAEAAGRLDMALAALQGRDGDAN